MAAWVFRLQTRAVGAHRRCARPENVAELFFETSYKSRRPWRGPSCKTIATRPLSGLRPLRKGSKSKKSPDNYRATFGRRRQKYLQRVLLGQLGVDPDLHTIYQPVLTPGGLAFATTRKVKLFRPAQSREQGAQAVFVWGAVCADEEPLYLVV